jgi:hypothetical protein
MTTIPLNKLDLAKANVRKTGGNDGIGERAVSIAAHEPLTSLDVRKAAHDRYTVIAGQRRYRALCRAHPCRGPCRGESLGLTAADKLAAPLEWDPHRWGRTSIEQGGDNVGVMASRIRTGLIRARQATARKPRGQWGATMASGYQPELPVTGGRSACRGS